MADKSQGGAAVGADTPGMPYYEKSRQHLKELLQNRKTLERQLHTREETIAQKESEYLENTASGNIITGFDNYIKGITGAAAQRRKTGITEANRLFTRSSISYNAANASNTPTPLQTSFKDGSGPGSGPGSGQATPTSTTAGKAAPSKKKKSAAAAAAAAASGVDDSETDTTRETKKVRTSFGTVRK
ncbi:hypothetical protein SCUCBS95973_004007 [Sporothrix curviconia]|uniref:Chromatin modification-related protein EAF6 n=1 Tax=Sporothrix curviconia TaxID=1260050 RepID=A0ABP0BK91_9PEZI